MSRAIRFIPLALLLAFVGFVAWRLMNPAETAIRSKLEGQPVPAFALPPAVPGHASFSSAELATGKPRIVNFFASWCVPCIAEAPQLMAMARRGIPIDAVAIRDRPEDIQMFLSRWGDPYRNVALDADKTPP